MAGPSIVNVSSVVDPFEGLQKAVSNVGDIYSDFDRENRETASHNAAVRDSNRVQEQRDFNRAYDPQLAIEGRGLTANTKKLYDAKEKEVAAHYQKIRDEGGKIPSAEELNTGLRDIRNSLITKEDAADVVRRDYLDQGFSPEEANNYAEVNTTQYTSRADMLGGETSRVDALNAQRKARRDAAEVTANILVDSKKAVKLTGAELKAQSYGKSTSWKGNNFNANSLGDSDLAARAQLVTAMEADIGNGTYLSEGDTQKAIKMADKAFYGFNKTRVDANLPPLPYSVLEKFMMAKTDSTFGDKSSMYNDAEAMRAGMDTEWANFIPKNRDWNDTSSKGKEKDSSSIVPQAYYDRINDTTQVAPRSMSQLEVIRVNRLFSSYGMNSASSSVAPKTERLPALGNEGESGGKADSGGSKQSLEEAKVRARELEQKRLGTLNKEREEVNKKLAEEKAAKEEGTFVQPVTGNPSIDLENYEGVADASQKELARYSVEEEDGIYEDRLLATEARRAAVTEKQEADAEMLMQAADLREEKFNATIKANRQALSSGSSASVFNLERNNYQKSKSNHKNEFKEKQVKGERKLRILGREKEEIADSLQSRLLEDNSRALLNNRVEAIDVNMANLEDELSVPYVRYEDRNKDPSTATPREAIATPELSPGFRGDPLDLSLRRGPRIGRPFNSTEPEEIPSNQDFRVSSPIRNRLDIENASQNSAESLDLAARISAVANYFA
jgi:hypothetical protein